MSPEDRDIWAAKMRLKEAPGRLERIRRMRKTTVEEQDEYRASMSHYWNQVATDRAFLKKTGHRIPRRPRSQA